MWQSGAASGWAIPCDGAASEGPAFGPPRGKGEGGGC